MESSNPDLKYAWVTCIPICFRHNGVIDDISGGIPEESIAINETFDLPRIAYVAYTGPSGSELRYATKFS